MVGTFSGMIVGKAGLDANITLFQGKTVDYTFILKENNIPVDVTGWSAALQARVSVCSTEVLVDFNSGDSSIVVGTTDGKFTLAKTDAETAAIDAFEGVYDMEITKDDGTVVQSISGKFTCVAEVTRA